MRRPAKWRRRSIGKQRFTAKYTPADIALLAEVDRAHQRLSGPATQCILQREHADFGNRKFTRLAEISVAHLYNLRNSAAYRKVEPQVAAVFAPTWPSPVSITERRRPARAASRGEQGA